MLLSLFDVLLFLLAASGLFRLGFLMGRRSAAPSYPMFPMGALPRQRMYDRDGPPPVGMQQGMYGQGYGPGYGQGYPMQQGMSPLAAGGLGALGGGLLGYQLGQAMAQDSAAPDAQPSDMAGSVQENAAQMSSTVVGNDFGYRSEERRVG